MKLLLIISLFTLLTFVGCNEAQSIKEAKLVTAKDSISYAIGIDIGKSLKTQEIDVSAELVMHGIKNAMDDSSKLTDDELRIVMMNFQKTLREQKMEKNALAAEKNKAEAEAFFAENKKKEGVVTLENGLQYKVLKEGNGKSPKPSSTVEAHYSGRLLDGTEFDSSYKRGQPYSTKLTNVIRGWTEILQLMQEGDKWEVYIPSDLAYGPRGSGQVIGPNAALIFELELIKVL